MIDACKFANVENKAIVGELAQFIGVEAFGGESTAKHFEAIEVCGIELFEGPDKGLHV